MRIGLIVRADPRGLGYQTKTYFDHLAPAVTVCVDMTPVTGQRFPQHFDWYPGAIQSRWAGYQTKLTDQALEALASVDVVLSAETFYDPRLPDFLHQRGVATVLHVNPEFYRGDQATMLWYPTSWQTDRLPPGTVVPIPIEDEHIAQAPAGPGLLLHVAGNPAAGDRNGTQTILQLVRRNRWDWRITSQAGIMLPPANRGMVQVVRHVDDRWTLYDGAAVLVLPRRYGGLCLPVLEAAAQGLAVVMPDVPPNGAYPAQLVPADPGAVLATAGGPVRLYNTRVGGLESMLHRLTSDPQALAAAQTAALEWARKHAWSRWRDEYLGLLAAAAARM